MSTNRESGSRAVSAKRRALFLALCAAVLAPARARAQSSDADARSAARRILLEQAQEAAAHDDHLRAIELAQRAAAIEVSPSLRLFIAQQHDSIADVAAAFGAADLCVRETERSASSTNRREEILQSCLALRARLHDRIARINVQVVAPPPGATVRVGEQVLDPLLYGVPFPVNPGSVTVTTAATGREPIETRYVIERGNEQRVVAEFGPVASAGSGRRRAVTAVRTQPPARRPRRSEPPSLLTRLAPPVALGVTGVVGLGLGVAFTVVRAGALAGCTVAADQVQCATPSQATRAFETARPMGVAATASYVAGGALLAAGVAWGAVVLATRPARDPRAVEVAPALSHETLGLFVRGAF